ncbi:MAG: hypothetical protein FI704_02080 [SAR202 cluster bacterium]|nr:hypothetical protein [SAR202 cluster bacterium]|tara:strand:- start:34648 stop:35001 length:354 start_codon:yes stop_codon:yes gene_type:complete
MIRVGIRGQLNSDAWKVSEMMSEIELIDMAKDTDKHKRRYAILIPEVIPSEFFNISRLIFCQYNIHRGPPITSNDIPKAARSGLVSNRDGETRKPIKCTDDCSNPFTSIDRPTPEIM